jgi:hypothetical protein
MNLWLAVNPDDARTLINCGWLILQERKQVASITDIERLAAGDAVAMAPSRRATRPPVSPQRPSFPVWAQPTAISPVGTSAATASSRPGWLNRAIQPTAGILSRNSATTSRAEDTEKTRRCSAGVPSESDHGGRGRSLPQGTMLGAYTDCRHRSSHHSALKPRSGLPFCG